MKPASSIGALARPERKNQSLSHASTLYPHFMHSVVAPPAFPGGGSALSERHGTSSVAGLAWRALRHSVAGPRNRGPSHRPRADRPRRPGRGARGARGARPHAPLAAAALALSLAGGRRAAAGAARLARVRCDLRRRGRRRQLRARRLRRQSRGTLAVCGRAPRPRLGARAARLRLAAPPRRGADPAKPGPWPSSWSASGSGVPPAARGACLGTRGRRPPRRLLAVARGPPARWRRAQALRRGHGQPHRPDHLPRRLLAQRARRLPPAPRPDRPRPRRPVHRRPRAPARAIAEAAGSRAGAPDPARRRPPQPQPLRARRAAARPAAAAPMLCRAQQSRPSRRCSRPSAG